MPHRRELTHEDIDMINRLRNNVPVAEIADRYKISYQRIYKIWKKDVNALPYERMIEQQHEQQIEDIINQAGEFTISENDKIAQQHENDIDSLQRENTKLKSLMREKSILLEKSIQHEKSKSSLRRELTAVQEQLEEITRVRDQLQIELSDVRSQFKTAQHNNRLLISQYDNLSKKYSALAIEVNNRREVKSPKSNDVQQHNAVQQQKKKKKRYLLPVSHVEKKLTDIQQLQRQQACIDQEFYKTLFQKT